MQQKRTESEIIFDEHWALYRKVIETNYMDHREIVAATTDYLERSRFSDGLGKVLDLGCGDAEVSSALVKRFGGSSFTGVDSSARAMQEAAKRSVWESIKTDFIESDFLAFPDQHDGPGYDLIFACFSVHHLSKEEKQRFFTAIKNCLSEKGELIFYDVFRLPGLDRDDSVTRYLQWIRNDWSEISGHEYELIEAHISAADFPESTDWIAQAAKDAGLGNQTKVLDCTHGFHHVFAFSAQPNRVRRSA